MKNKVGFTLIEVVIVIVILGIITAIAAPRFFNLQTDARNAALTALAASIETAGEFVFTKAVLQGKETALSESIQVGGETIELVYGYPVETFSNLAKVVDGLGGNNSKWKECNRGELWSRGCITFASFPDTNSEYINDCFVLYMPIVYKKDNTIHSQNNANVMACL